MFVAFTFFTLLMLLFWVTLYAVVLLNLNAAVAVERIFGKSNLQVKFVLDFCGGFCLFVSFFVLFWLRFFWLVWVF